MFGHKAQSICNAWFKLAKYNDGYSTIKGSYINQQHELIINVNQCVLQPIKQRAVQNAMKARGKPLHMLKGKLLLLRDHPEGQNKIQDGFKSELFVTDSQPQDHNVYIIKPINSKDVRSTHGRYLT